MPKISIIVPVYKAKATLARCVDSILAQTYRDFEVLLVEDGSPDRSGELCDNYAKKDARVRAVHQKNAGAAAARNRGIADSVGEYLAFTDSDDYLEPDYLETLFDTIRANDADLAVCNFLPVQGSKKEEPVKHGFAEGELLAGNALRETFSTRIAKMDTDGFFSLWNKLIRADLVKKNALALNPKMSFGEDLCFLLDVFSHAESVAFTERALYCYERSETGLFSSYRPSTLDDSILCYQKLLAFLSGSGKDLSSLHCRYFYYVNRHIEQALAPGRRDRNEVRRTLLHPGVKDLFCTFASLSEADLQKNGLTPYEQKLPRLVANGKTGAALRHACYLFDRQCFLRRLRTFKNVLPQILRERGACKFRSLKYSLRAGGLFAVYPHSKIIIDKNAALTVDGNFYFNKPFHGKSKNPATLVVGIGATFSVNGYFVMREGVYVTVEPSARLSLSDGVLNNGGKISCFEKITLGRDVRLSEDVILRDSDNHEIERKGYLKTAPIAVGDHVWVGLRAVILKGVTIGDGSIVAAGALVNKTVPPHSTVAGVPAKIIASEVSWK